MNGGDTQLIDYSSQRSPSHSSASGESIASDGNLHDPTQLLYTQLLEGRLEKSRKTRHLHLDMETQLIEEHNSDDFRKDGGLILPSEDEASKETQLIHGDEVHSASSSGKDGEVDSALSHLSTAFRQKTPPWLSDFAHRNRSVGSVAGRTPQISCPYRERYLGDTQPLSEDEDGKCHGLAAKEDFVDGRVGIGARVDSQPRDVDVPHFLRDFDPSRPDLAGQRMMAGWPEVAGYGDGAHEYDRGGWDAAVRGLQLVDSEASTEDEENHNSQGFNSGLSSPGRVHLPQKTGSKLAKHVSSNFCKQDLNKLPEPETLIDELDNGNMVDHGLGRVIEGEPCAAHIHRVEQEPGYPLNDPFIGNRSSEGVEEKFASTIRLTGRTAGSIRTASLRASALQPLSCSNTNKYCYVQGSKIVQEAERQEQVGICGNQPPLQKTEHDAAVEIRSNLPRNKLGSSGNTLPAAKTGGLSSAESLLGSSKKNIIMRCSGKSDKDGLMVDACGRGGASSIFGHGQNDGPPQQFPLEAGGIVKTADSKVSKPGMNHSNAGQKSLERRSSDGLRVSSTRSDMCSMNSQSPGDDSQAKALNMVDKLVWLNAIGLPRELQLEENKDKDKAPVLTPGHSKSVFQSRAQMAEAKSAKSGPLGVFDWVDSQNDEAGAIFGGGNGKGNAGSKGVCKPSIASGPCRQSGIGPKICPASDGEVVHSRAVSKPAEKVKGINSNPSTYKQDAFLSTNSSMMMENKAEERRGRPGSRAATADNRPRSAAVEQSFTSVHLPQATVGDVKVKEGFPDKSFMKFGTTERSLLTSKLPQQTRKQERMSSEIGRNKEGLASLNSVANTIDMHARTENKKLELTQDISAKDCCDAEASLVTPDASEGSAQHVLDETSAPEESDERDDEQIGDLVHFARQVETDNAVHTIETKVERGNSTVVDLACSYQVLGPGDDLEAGLERPLKRSKISGADICTNDSRVAESLPVQQQSSADTVQPCVTSESGRSQSKPSKSSLHGTKIKGFAGRKGARDFGNIEKKSEALVNGRLGESIVHRNVMVSPPLQNFQEGENIRFATKEPPEAMKIIHSNPSDFQVARKHRNGSDEFASKSSSSRQELEDERKSDSEEEMQFVSKVAQATARRGRSQTRNGVRALGRSDPQCHLNKFIHPKRGRRRRVTWAGPVVEAPKQSVGVRGHRSLKWHDQENGHEDVEAEDSSEQEVEEEDEEEEEGGDEEEEDEENEEEDEENEEEDVEEEEVEEEEVDVEEEEAVEIKETRSENGARKRSTGTVEMSSGDNDLAKIKRRFNMSDSAVARLLGTDEEDNPERNQAVKVRSLRHIQPHSDEIGRTPNLTFRKVSKGLRSARNRSEVGCRRPWPFLITDHEKSEWEERASPRDELVEDGNVDETTMLETHPSDNEVLTGRRRMRSIADVSFPNLLFSTSGRPLLHQGLRRRRGRHIVKSPREASPDPSDDELADVPPCAPPSISPVFGQLRGKGGPRSARKRKDCEFDRLAAMSESLSPNSSKEVSPTGFKRTKRPATICVLLSHGLNQDSIKKQAKIVTKLGGKVASNSSDCTHFVADKFVRTGNMLEAMAAGKPVVTMEWLQKCSEANRVVNEDDFILEDKRKEEELGFSMITTLAAARQRPLLQGIRVYITPGTSPGPDSLAKIIKSAGGQVVDEYKGTVVTRDRASDFCIVISSEEEFDDCIPLLEQGAKVYTPELLLSGVTNYHLDFSTDQLFKNFTRRRRRGSACRRTV